MSARAAGPRPRPLAQCPRGVLAEVAGLMTDIDDTLTREGAIEPAALQALQDLKAAGLPVIASNACGSAVELVRPYFNGRMVATENPDAMARGMLWLDRAAARMNR